MDLRAEELTTLNAIYHDTLSLADERLLESQTPPESPNNRPLNYAGVVHVPISLDAPMEVSHSGVSHRLHHLPPLELAFSLPPLYPYEECPEIHLNSSFLPNQVHRQLENELRALWHNSKDQVLFAMVDHILGLVAQPMHLLKKSGHCCVSEDSIVLCQGPTKVSLGSDPRLMDRLICFDKDQTQKVFNSSTFVCGICQENAFGSRSFKFPRCNHVFCMRCLKHFFISLIEDANVEKVHCPDFICSKDIASERESHISSRICNDFDFDEFKKKLMTPPILLDDLKHILEFENTGCADAPRDFYEKYLALFLDHSHTLIAKLFPARIVTCAGDFCTNMIFRRDVTDLLVVCRKCGYAFCNNCRKSNHTKTRECTGVRDKRQYFGISEDDLEVWTASKTAENAGKKEQLRRTYGLDLLRKLALEYDMDKMDRLFSELISDGDFCRCPTCDLVIQRSDGCNKMKCSACYSFFCNICGAFLPPDTPYEHFNDKSSACYGKLFEGMPGIDET